MTTELVRRYRKRPVVIEAALFDGTADNAWQLLQWLQGAGSYEHEHKLVILTLEGYMRANPGDWIIRSVKGEFYPCKPDIFAATYEAIS